MILNVSAFKCTDVHYQLSVLTLKQSPSDVSVTYANVEIFEPRVFSKYFDQNSYFLVWLVESKGLDWTLLVTNSVHHQIRLLECLR